MAMAMPTFLVGLLPGYVTLEIAAPIAARVAAQRRLGNCRLFQVCVSRTAESHRHPTTPKQ
jgi:hypothetical protein